MLGADRRGVSARRGMTVLGKIPAVPKPINLPSQRLENRGLDPSVDIVPRGTVTWGSSAKTSTPASAWNTSASPPTASSSWPTASSAAATATAVSGSSMTQPKWHGQPPHAPIDHSHPPSLPAEHSHLNRQFPNHPSPFPSNSSNRSSNDRDSLFPPLLASSNNEVSDRQTKEKQQSDESSQSKEKRAAVGVGAPDARPIAGGNSVDQLQEPVGAWRGANSNEVVQPGTQSTSFVEVKQEYLSEVSAFGPNAYIHGSATDAHPGGSVFPPDQPFNAWQSPVHGSQRSTDSAGSSEGRFVASMGKQQQHEERREGNGQPMVGRHGPGEESWRRDGREGSRVGPGPGFGSQDWRGEGGIAEGDRWRHEPNEEWRSDMSVPSQRFGPHYHGRPPPGDSWQREGPGVIYPPMGPPGPHRQGLPVGHFPPHLHPHLHPHPQQQRFPPVMPPAGRGIPMSGPRPPMMPPFAGPPEAFHHPNAGLPFRHMERPPPFEPRGPFPAAPPSFDGGLHVAQRGPLGNFPPKRLAGAAAVAGAKPGHTHGPRGPQGKRSQSEGISQLKNETGGHTERAREEREKSGAKEESGSKQSTSGVLDWASAENEVMDFSKEPIFGSRGVDVVEASEVAEVAKPDKYIPPLQRRRGQQKQQAASRSGAGTNEPQQMRILKRPEDGAGQGGRGGAVAEKGAAKNEVQKGQEQKVKEHIVENVGEVTSVEKTVVEVLVEEEKAEVKDVVMDISQISTNEKLESVRLLTSMEEAGVTKAAEESHLEEAMEKREVETAPVAAAAAAARTKHLHIGPNHVSGKETQQQELKEKALVEESSESATSLGARKTSIQVAIAAVSDHATAKGGNATSENGGIHTEAPQGDLNEQLKIQFGNFDAEPLPSAPILPLVVQQSSCASAANTPAFSSMQTATAAGQSRLEAGTTEGSRLVPEQQSSILQQDAPMQPQQPQQQQQQQPHGHSRLGGGKGRGRGHREVPISSHLQQRWQPAGSTKGGENQQLLQSDASVQPQSGMGILPSQGQAAAATGESLPSTESMAEKPLAGSNMSGKSANNAESSGSNETAGPSTSGRRRRGGGKGRGVKGGHASREGVAGNNGNGGKPLEESGREPAEADPVDELSAPVSKTEGMKTVDGSKNDGGRRQRGGRSKVVPSDLADAAPSSSNPPPPSSSRTSAIAAASAAAAAALKTAIAHRATHGTSQYPAPTHHATAPSAAKELTPSQGGPGSGGMSTDVHGTDSVQPPISSSTRQLPASNQEVAAAASDSVEGTNLAVQPQTAAAVSDGHVAGTTKLKRAELERYTPRAALQQSQPVEVADTARIEVKPTQVDGEHAFKREAEAKQALASEHSRGRSGGWNRGRGRGRENSTRRLVARAEKDMEGKVSQGPVSVPALSSGIAHIEPESTKVSGAAVSSTAAGSVAANVQSPPEKGKGVSSATSPAIVCSPDVAVRVKDHGPQPQVQPTAHHGGRIYIPGGFGRGRGRGFTAGLGSGRQEKPREVINATNGALPHSLAS